MGASFRSWSMQVRVLPRSPGALAAPAEIVVSARSAWVSTSQKPQRYGKPHNRRRCKDLELLES